MATVVDITSKAQFDELVKSTPYVALQAHASWCGPCKAISPFFTKHAGSFGSEKYAFARFDTDDVSDLAVELGIRSIPAFFFFENGEKTENLTGANPPALQKLAAGFGEKAKGGEAPLAASEAPLATNEAPLAADEAPLATNEDF